MRAPNTVDFWRGFALLEIFVNHVPDHGLSRFTHGQFSWSDAAELFVFLSGWTFARRLNGSRPASMEEVLSFAGNRVARIWTGQVMTAFCVAVLYLGAARFLSDPGILDANFARSAITDPAAFAIGVPLLLQQVRFVDILPLYVILGAMTPVIFWIGRRSTALLAALSAALFALSLFWRPELPTWPEHGRWFFDPLSWQAIFVLGYLVGRRRDFVADVVARVPAIVPLSCTLVALAAAATLAGLTPPLEPPRDSLAYYFFGKSALGLLAVPQFLALALVVSRTTFLVPRFAGLAWRLLSLLGRNSLAVFCAGTVLSAIGQICHRAGWRGALFDIAFTLVAAVILLCVARAREISREAGRRAMAPAPLAAARADPLGA